MNRKMTSKKSVKKDRLKKAVSQSSGLEGLSFFSAKKNKKIINLLKTCGRAFAVSCQR